MTQDFSANLVKSYEHWDLYVHTNQGYLGRLVIWCKREDAAELTDATPEEEQELFLVMKEARHALEKSFTPDRLNYFFGGNEEPHLHCHMVPRYEEPRIFADTRFEDFHYGHHYKTDRAFVTGATVLAAVRDKLQEVI